MSASPLKPVELMTLDDGRNGPIPEIAAPSRGTEIYYGKGSERLVRLLACNQSLRSGTTMAEMLRVNTPNDLSQSLMGGYHA